MYTLPGLETWTYMVTVQCPITMSNKLLMNTEQCYQRAIENRSSHVMHEEVYSTVFANSHTPFKMWNDSRGT